MVAGRGIFDAIGGGWLCIGNTRRFIVKSNGAARLSVQPLVEETSLNNTMQLSDLREGKHAVVIDIEQDEAACMAYLEQKMETV